MNQTVINEKFIDYPTTVAQCMTKAGAEKLLSSGKPVMLKPNLINASPYPITTPPAFCEAVINFIRKHTAMSVVIAEGCGDPYLETSEIFEQLGYTKLAKRLNVSLLDLNRAQLVLKKNAACRVFKEMWLPKVVFEHLLISLPMLKVHSLSRLTGSMKNMMGLVPPEHYSGSHGFWKKAAFHQHLDEAIVDLNLYRPPDFTIMDATMGLAEYHLGGPHCKPPVNRIIAGFDARTVDRKAAELLGMDWKTIGHLT